MADSLKTFFSNELVARLAASLRRAHGQFPEKRFIAEACAGLDTLELVARGKHIAKALARSLPQQYPAAIEVLLQSLGPKHATDELVGAGMAPFFYLPHTLFVVEYGLEHFELSMRAQYELTQRFTAESSVRAYIQKDPERCFTFFTQWLADPNPHVRRLVSEGTRLRLPWASRVAWLDANPHRVVELLDRLKDDPASVVRRSVANNLNDLGKVHPNLFYETCRAWQRDASREREALLEHALRSAIKRGEGEALRILGYGEKPKVKLTSCVFHPSQVRVGDTVVIKFELQSTASKAQDFLIDLAIHFVKANGRTAPKVFKVKRLALAPQARAALEARVSFKVHTTRRPHPGIHLVEIVVNGQALPAGSFEVHAAPPTAKSKLTATTPKKAAPEKSARKAAATSLRGKATKPVARKAKQSSLKAFRD